VALTEVRDRHRRPAHAGSSVPAAREVANRLLAGEHERLEHSAAVAARAAALVPAVPRTDAGLLVAAAWLHDIGYSPLVRVTGFHPLDGARHLRAAGWDPALCALVAHHSGSRFVAAENGFGDLLAEFDHVDSPVSDALTTADQTVGPHGAPLSLDERLRDMLERHGPASANARAHPRREASVRAAHRRVTRRLDRAALGGLGMPRTGPARTDAAP
jgi:hypothetical protein